MCPQTDLLAGAIEHVSTPFNSCLQTLGQVSEESHPEGVKGSIKSLFSACKTFLDKEMPRERGEP